MSIHNNNNESGRGPIEIDEPRDSEFLQVSQPAAGSVKSELGEEPAAVATSEFATRTSLKEAEGFGKTKLLLLGGGLAIAVLFLVFTAIVGKSPKKRVAGNVPAQQAKQDAVKRPKGSVTPVMDTVRTPAPDNASGQLGPGDIRRTRSLDGRASAQVSTPLGEAQTTAKTASSGTLGSVPSFSDTQQKWEEPQPYGGPTVTPASQTQQQNSLKEPSLVFVRSQVQNQALSAAKAASDSDNASLLDLTPGTRIQAKLQAEISSAVQDPVVAVVEYTYAIGDRIVVPAGARVYGKLQQDDRSGLVSLKFDEVELLDGTREKIDAVGLGLDLGPIKGNVSGKNTGKNFLVRAASGMGSVLAEIAGNNSSAAFSEDDMLRERLAENIGTAGDTEVMNLNANSRIVVSVPSDTKIYIVFARHEETSPQLHKVASTTP